MAGFLGDLSVGKSLRISTEENWREKYSLEHGVSNIFILDTSKTMDGEGFTQMKKTFVSMIESYSLQPNWNEQVAVIHFGKENKYLHYLSNNYESLKRVLDDISCSGPSAMIGGFLLAIPGLEDLQCMTNIGLFTVRARVILISDGRTTTSSYSDSNCYNHQIEEDHKTMQLLEQVQQIGNKHPIICVPVGKDPNISLLGTIAHGSLGGKLVHPEEARKFTRYTFGMENVVEILNNRRAYEMFVYGNEEHLGKEVYTECNKFLPAPGTRVSRGPKWHYNDQDSNGPGTVTGHQQRGTKNGWIYVEWDTGMRFPYEYMEDSQEENVIIPCNEPRILQRENIAVGCLVKRGNFGKIIH
ncbi:uncharacterized protein LOC134262818 isoform X2 [Saccostrea cucullata]|uniref:uncharacterized protein LOC134262818 isoform X2 n=1 Tax=Saccostrea cuccullata TaxID=36930 RepID=UPI002ED34FBA